MSKIEKHYHVTVALSEQGLQNLRKMYQLLKDPNFGGFTITVEPEEFADFKDK
jgi:hypothetical protein